MVPETDLPNSTSHTASPSSPLRQVFVLTNKHYDVAVPRRPKHKMNMIGHQTVGIDWNTGLLCMCIQRVPRGSRDAWIRENFTPPTRANCYGADHSQLTVEFSIKANALVVELRECWVPLSSLPQNLRGTSPRATADSSCDYATNLGFRILLGTTDCAHSPLVY